MTYRDQLQEAAYRAGKDNPITEDTAGVLQTSKVEPKRLELQRQITTLMTQMDDPVDVSWVTQKEIAAGNSGFDDWGETELTPLYLGHWLAMMSQLDDPVGYPRLIQEKTKDGTLVFDQFKVQVTTLVAEIISIVQEKINQLNPNHTLQADLQHLSLLAAQDLYASIQFLANHSWGQNKYASTFMRDTCYFLGFFQFVEGDKNDKTWRNLTFHQYSSLFGSRASFNKSKRALQKPGVFNQYYPNEHFDRPLMHATQHPAVYAPGKQTLRQPARVAAGKRSGLRAKSSKHKQLNPDLYSYVRDTLEMSAGLLAETDLAFEQYYAKRKYNTSLAWQKKLTQLGWVTHQLECFFSRSNWIELAIHQIGNSQFEPSDSIETTLFTQRLKRALTEAQASWQEHPIENWGVTGALGFQDVLVRTSNLSQQLFSENYGNKQLALAQKILQHTFDFILNPEKAINDSQNTVAKLVVAEVPVQEVVQKRTEDEFLKKIAEMVIAKHIALKTAPKQVQLAWINLVVAGGKTSVVEGVTVTLYKSLRQISAFMHHPVLWLNAWMPQPYHGFILKEKDTLYNKLRAEAMLAINRIGSFCLLNKGNAQDYLVRDQRKFSLVIIHQVLRTLLRWRSQPTPETANRYVEWLALLEYFSKNPLQTAERKADKSVGVNVQAKTQGETLASLALRYRTMATNKRNFNWRTIVDTNFPTKGLPDQYAMRVFSATLAKNRYLAHKRITSPSDFTVTANTLLIIPDQTTKLTVFKSFGDNFVWFKSVFYGQWHTYTNFTPEPTLVSHQAVLYLIKRGKRLRREARLFYQKLEHNLPATTHFKPTQYATTNNLYEFNPPFIHNEFVFAARHPLIAPQIGTADTDNVNVYNITSIATRFQLNSRLPKKVDRTFEATPGNAYRHALWQAMLTIRFGTQITQKVGDSHEKNSRALLGYRVLSTNSTKITVRIPNQIIFNNVSIADETIDLLNNIIGRLIGLLHPNSSNTQLALVVLEHYHRHGLWQTNYLSDEYKPRVKYPIERVKLEPKVYSAARSRLLLTGESGFTRKKEREIEAKRNAFSGGGRQQNYHP